MYAHTHSKMQLLGTSQPVSRQQHKASYVLADQLMFSKSPNSSCPLVSPQFYSILHDVTSYEISLA